MYGLELSLKLSATFGAKTTRLCEWLCLPQESQGWGGVGEGRHKLDFDLTWTRLDRNKTFTG